jgi:hypothetical protein
VELLVCNGGFALDMNECLGLCCGLYWMILELSSGGFFGSLITEDFRVVNCSLVEMSTNDAFIFIDLRLMTKVAVLRPD